MAAKQKLWNLSASDVGQSLDLLKFKDMIRVICEVFIEE